MKKSEQVGELVAALAKAQAEFTPALKDSKNPYYNSKYADLAAVIGAVRPALNKHGVILTQDISADLERQVAIVRTSLYHGEQFFEIEIEAPAKGQSKKDENSGMPGTKFDVQTIGAGTLYLRRYSVAAICGLAAEDDEEDDGNSLDNNNKPISKKVPCPKCGKDAIIQGKPEYGGGWLCYKQKGGCGAKFTVDPAIVNQNSSTEPDLPSEVQPPPAAPQTASQSRVGPTKRIPPTPPENVPGLLCTVKRIKESPKKGNVNANISVVLDEVLNGSNQGVAWVCSYATCWHASLFEAIRQSVGKECKFFIKERDAKLNDSDEWPTHFIDIEDVAFIDGQEFMDGKPVIQAQQ
jgi:hypothetical protein